MKRNTHALAEMVQELLRLKAEQRRRELILKRRDSGGSIQEVHEADISVDPSSFKVISESTTDDGDTLIEWEVVEYVLTEFTVDEPYRFEKSGRLLIKQNGEAELL